MKIKGYYAFLSAVKMLYPKLVLKFFTTFLLRSFGRKFLRSRPRANTPSSAVSALEPVYCDTYAMKDSSVDEYAKRNKLYIKYLK